MAYSAFDAQRVAGLVSDAVVRVSSGSSSGSGFAYKRNYDGYLILTNQHVIDGEDPKLRRVLGLRSPAAPKPSRFPASEDVEARAGALEEELQAMATDDVVASLERSKESVAVLAALARRLGMRVGSKGRKSDLAKRIATHIANRRSYDFLRNRTARAS